MHSPQPIAVGRMSQYLPRCSERVNVPPSISRAEKSGAGLLSAIRHTSNGLAWLKSNVPEYDGEGRYVNVLDVAENGMITANAAGYVDYAYEVIKVLELLDEPERRAWYRLHREGVLPPGS